MDGEDLTSHEAFVVQLVPHPFLSDFLHLVFDTSAVIPNWKKTLSALGLENGPDPKNWAPAREGKR